MVMTDGGTEMSSRMRIDWDVPIVMDDGVTLRADVFRPLDDSTPVPSLLSYGPYGKGLRFSDHYPMQWERLISKHPDVLEGSTGKYQAWETVDPEKWVPMGYACVRVDSRGAGRSPGFIDPHSPREIADTALCIDWAGTQEWCNGKVAVVGISYFADNAWAVASLEQPPRHLAAICPWEGSADHYRDVARQGGILTTFMNNWWDARILKIQHGVGERGFRSPNTGELASGPDTLTEQELAANRGDFCAEVKSHGFDDSWTQARSAKWENVKVPFLSAANWGGQGLHLRGNVEGFVRAATEHKWLEFHGLEHWTLFYTSYGIDLQRRFFDRFLKDDESGWTDQPRVLLNVRHVDGTFRARGEDDWPLPDTVWKRVYLDAAEGALRHSLPDQEASVSFDALGPGVTFLGPPLEEELEVTGPMASKLSISSSTTDADLFLVVHVYDGDGKEVTFQGSMDPHSCIGKGWLRASHRKLDLNLTYEYRPYHTHDLCEPLSPNESYELDVEIWPTCIVVPPGYRIGLSILGRDFFHPIDDGERADFFGNSEVRYGSGPIVHDDPEDRPESIYGGITTVHTGPGRQNYVLLPTIPPRE